METTTALYEVAAKTRSVQFECASVAWKVQRRTLHIYSSTPVPNSTSMLRSQLWCIDVRVTSMNFGTPNPLKNYQKWILNTKNETRNQIKNYQNTDKKWIQKWTQKWLKNGAFLAPPPPKKKNTLIFGNPRELFFFRFSKIVPFLLPKIGPIFIKSVYKNGHVLIRFLQIVGSILGAQNHLVNIKTGGYPIGPGLLHFFV